MVPQQYLNFQKIVLILLFHSTTIVLSYGNECPEEFTECDCDIISGSLSIDCSGKELRDIPDFLGAQQYIQSLDLSNNHLLTFPNNLLDFPLLTTLDLSNNQISKIPETALEGCSHLRFLYINKNNITNWADINPNVLLQPADSLETLSLSGNPITSFTSIDQSYVLTSASLKLLDLSNCRITKVTGQYVLVGLVKLEHLILSGNPLRGLSDLISGSLLSMDVSNCKLTFLQSTVFNQLPQLTYVNFARNHRLSMSRKPGEYVQSVSLKRLDLSLCNMDEIELQGFPNLMTVILRGNLIRHLNKENFENNPDLENIDISFNSISHISSSSFRGLRFLKNLDLSYNMIRRIEKETFKENEFLTNINLSRNYIERLNRFVAHSLTHLNMSWCEIITIDLDAFNEMPELIELDLSNNLFSDFPVSLHSETLQTLNLGTCRLSSIKNATFRGFPELTRLNLAGNRFTTTFRKDFFKENIYLQDLWLGDNPWRCDCSAPGFYEFYTYLVEHPSRINDRAQLRCNSPEVVYGSAWDVACFNIWYSNNQVMGTTQKVWTFLMVTIIVFTGSICLIMSIRRCIEGRKLTQREEERIRNLEESREIMRQNTSMLEQEAQLNAPDPRESRPPCYADAILLPRLDGSCVSLDDLNAKRRKRQTSDKDNETNLDAPISRRNRCRSEDVLSRRESTANSSRTHERIIPLHNNDNQISIAPTIEIPPREPEVPELHYLSTDILRLNHNLSSAEPMPQTSQNLIGNRPEVAELVEDIQNFEHIGGSPYAQRKSKHMSSFKSDKPPESNSSSDEMNIVEDHYSKNSLDSSNISSEDFSTFSSDEIKNLK